MANPQTTGFQPFAGQLVANGVANHQPVVSLEQSVTRETFDAINTINGLMPKINDLIIRETRIFSSPLDPVFERRTHPYGLGVEQAVFKDGVPNKRRPGTCIPQGNVEMVSQFGLVNYTYNVSVDVKDREVNMAVANAEEAAIYVAEKLRTPLKTMASLKYRAQVQLISDVTDGTRSISSDTSSALEGGTITYNPTITGYAGMVDQLDLTLAPLEVGVVPTFQSADDALEIAEELKNAAAEMMFESTAYNKLQVNTFIYGRPCLVMEKKTLNAMDHVFSVQAGYKGFPTVSAREYLREFADLYEIDAFAELPTNNTYNDKRLVATMFDRDMWSDTVRWADMESNRCTNERFTGYNYQGESTIMGFRGVPSYAALVNKA